MDINRQLSQLLMLVRRCRAQIAQDQAIVDEYEKWKNIRSNVGSCRQEFQKTSPDPGNKPARNEYDAQLQEINWTWDLANDEVVRTYHAVAQVKRCLDTVRKEAQQMSESLLIEPRWAEALTKYKDDLEGLEQRLIEMLEHDKTSPSEPHPNPPQPPTSPASRPGAVLNPSAERMKFLKDLTGELANISIRINDGMTPAEVREQYPDYEAWKLLDEHGYENELTKEDFRAKQLAQRLTMHHFGVKQSTLQKDPETLRKHNAKFSNE